MTFEPSTLTTQPTEWLRVDAALDELLALEPDQWPEAIGRIAHGDPALADELHSLLAAALEGQRDYRVRRADARDDVPDEAARRAAQPRDLDKAMLGMAAQMLDRDDAPRAAGPSSRIADLPRSGGDAAGRGRPARAPRTRSGAGVWPWLLAVAVGVAVAVAVRVLHG